MQKSGWFDDKSFQENKAMPKDYNRHLCSELITHKEIKGLKEKPYLAHGHLSMTIAYQALGMKEELSNPISKDEALHVLGPMKVKPLNYPSMREEQNNTL